MRCAIVLMLTLLSLSMSNAGDLQYLIDTGDISGVQDAPAIPTVAGYGVVTIAESVTAIQWPIPGGCTVGGQWGWTRITDAGAVTVAGAGMAIRPELVGLFFSTTSPLLPGCYLVPTWRDLKKLYESTIIAAIAEQDLINVIGVLNGWKAVRCVAPGDDSNQNCIDWSAQMAIINTRLPGRGQGITISTDIATLITEVFDFKTAKGW